LRAISSIGIDQRRLVFGVLLSHAWAGALLLGASTSAPGIWRWNEPALAHEMSPARRSPRHEEDPSAEGDDVRTGGARRLDADIDCRSFVTPNLNRAIH
jgi:hypothetical protein